MKLVKSSKILLITLVCSLSMSGCVYSHNYDKNGNEMSKEQVEETLENIREDIKEEINSSVTECE